MGIMEYYTPTHVYFGEGAVDKVARVLAEQGATKVLVHFGSGSVKKSGLLDKVEGLLREAGIEYVELGGVVPNPRVSLVRKGIEIFKFVLNTLEISYSIPVAVGKGINQQLVSR